MATVIQADRLVASEIVRYGAPGVGNGNTIIASEIKGGLHDNYAIVQEVASHREASTAKLEADMAVLVEALDWALAEIDGRTRYDPKCAYNAEEQRGNALAKARETLTRIQGDDACGGGHE